MLRELLRGCRVIVFARGPITLHFVCLQLGLHPIEEADSQVTTHFTVRWLCWGVFHFRAGEAFCAIGTHNQNGKG